MPLTTTFIFKCRHSKLHPVDVILFRSNTSFALNDKVKPITMSYGRCYDDLSKPVKMYITGWPEVEYLDDIFENYNERNK